ncbi:class I SAM-dependent methyltransferase [Croceibacter atlanticus]|uniref:class I SAM-dependent methyltransferase n=1 Tax=Croceibacter atlanticus TaxID=313588 RepID=UPI0024913301|nr:class I SAM-dependent methyltransferase [Croceibacter atlanticus]
MTDVTRLSKKEMNYTETQAILGKVDIYLIDQILKNRYATDDSILDAGCGEGRNLRWFYANNYKIYGIDTDIERLENAKLMYPKSANNFQVGNLDALPYGENEFNHVICSAVLHFAQSEKHFYTMLSELVRVLKPQGTLLIRMGSDIGLDGNIPYLKESQTNRAGTFYLNRQHIEMISRDYNIEFIEPIKTTNVEDKRAMTTLVIQKL